MAAAFSPVDTIAFPVPAVVFVENKRNKPVPSCTVPAAPPPAMIASSHLSIALNSAIGKNDAASTVPAATASGVAIVSSRLSIKGSEIDYF